MEVRPALQPRPRVVVVIPTYNRARWLPGAIGSVLAQTYGELALVVSDNGSTDGTAAIVAAVDDPRVSYVRQPENVDLNAHFNRCLQLGSAGDYVFLLPDDDRMLPDLLDRSVAMLEASPAAGAVHAQARLVDEDGRTIEEAHDMSGLGRDCVEGGADYIRRAMAGGYRVHGSTVLFRSLAIASARYDGRDFPATDFALMLRLALHWDVAFLACPLAEYRIHGATYTADAGARAGGTGYVQGIEMIRAIRAAKLRFVNENALRLERPGALRRSARRAMRRALVVRADCLAADRSPRTTAVLLARSARIAPGILLEPSAWRLLLANLIGARARARLRSLRGVGHLGPPSRVTGE